MDFLEELEGGMDGGCWRRRGSGVGGVGEVFVCETVVRGGNGEGLHGDFF